MASSYSLKYTKKINHQDKSADTLYNHARAASRRFAQSLSH
jgi:hypothetical protein